MILLYATYDFQRTFSIITIFQAQRTAQWTIADKCPSFHIDLLRVSQYLFEDASDKIGASDYIFITYKIATRQEHRTQFILSIPVYWFIDNPIHLIPFGKVFPVICKLRFGETREYICMHVVTWCSYIFIKILIFLSQIMCLAALLKWTNMKLYCYNKELTIYHSDQLNDHERPIFKNIVTNSLNPCIVFL